eukprot:Gb_13194 [translate_table: standard]
MCLAKGSQPSFLLSVEHNPPRGVRVMGELVAPSSSNSSTLISSSSLSGVGTSSRCANLTLFANCLHHATTWSLIDQAFTHFRHAPLSFPLANPCCYLFFILLPSFPPYRPIVYHKMLLLRHGKDPWLPLEHYFRT